MLCTGDGPFDSNPQSCWACHEVVGRGCLLAGGCQVTIQKDWLWTIVDNAGGCQKETYLRVWNRFSISGLIWLMLFNPTLNNISAISLRSVLLMEETGIPRENHWPVASHWQIVSHNVVSSTLRKIMRFELTTCVVIGTDCTGSCQSNYHAITTTTAPSVNCSEIYTIPPRALSLPVKKC